MGLKCTELSSGEPFIAVAAGGVYISGQNFCKVLLPIREMIFYFMFCACTIRGSHKENLVRALILRLFCSFPLHVMRFSMEIDAFLLYILFVALDCTWVYGVIFSCMINFKNLCASLNDSITRGQITTHC